MTKLEIRGLQEFWRKADDTSPYIEAANFIIDQLLSERETLKRKIEEADEPMVLTSHSTIYKDQNVIDFKKYVLSLFES